MIDPAKPDFSYTPAHRPENLFAYEAATSGALPVVTIITPFFNTGAVFHETAKSVFSQSLQQFEWIIINDGSSDGESLKILDGYRNRDPRIRVIDHAANKGLAAARNTGFREARAEFVYQLDSDDLIEPTTLEKCAWFLCSHPGIQFTKGYTIGFGAKNYLWKKGFEDTAEFLENNPVTATAMIRKSAHAKCGGYDETRTAGFEDWDFWLKSAAAGLWGATIPEFMDWYRTRQDHGDRWQAFKQSERERTRLELINKYLGLKNTGFPPADRWNEQARGVLEEEIPFPNRLQKEKKKRLLFVLPWFAVGGAEKFNLDLLKLLTEEHGYEVTICATLSSDLTWLPRFQQFTSDIFVLPHFLRPEDHPRFISYLIESRQIDAYLLTCSQIGYQLLPYIRARYPQLPILDFNHIEQESWRDGNYPRCSVNYRSSVDLTVVVSNFLKNWMIQRGAEADRIEVCYINVDSQFFRPSPHLRTQVRQELNLSSDIPIILFAARLSSQKRPHILAETIARLERDGVNFVCLVAGDGPEEESLKQFIKANGLQKLRLLGLKNPEEVKGLMAAADTFFLPSEHEGVSLACYEAMAMGVPIVCSDVGGQSELITPDCGVLVKKEGDEVSEYAGALKRLVTDSSERRTMASSARCRIEQQFDLRAMGTRMVRLIEKASALRIEQPRAYLCPTLAKTFAIEMLEQNRLNREILWHRGLNPYAGIGNAQLNDLSVQVFVPQNGKYTAENSATTRFSSGQLTLLRVELPSWNFSEIRVDPSNAAGLLTIVDAIIRDLQTNQVVWNMHDKKAARVKVKGTAERLASGTGFVVFASGNDPQLHFNLCALPRSNNKLALEITYKHEKVLPAVLPQFTAPYAPEPIRHRISLSFAGSKSLACDTSNSSEGNFSLLKKLFKKN